MGVWGDHHIPGLTKLADGIRERGSISLAQIFHGGLSAPESLTGLQPVSASENPLPDGMEGTSRELTGDEIEQISIIKPVSGETVRTLDHVYIYPARHFVMPEDRIQSALRVIREELAQQLETFQSQGKLLEAQRLSARTRFDLEMMAGVGQHSDIRTGTKDAIQIRTNHNGTNCRVLETQTLGRVIKLDINTEIVRI